MHLRSMQAGMVLLLLFLSLMVVVDTGKVPADGQKYMKGWQRNPMKFTRSLTELGLSVVY